MYGNTMGGTTDLYDPADFNVVYGSLPIGTIPGVVAFGWDDLTAFEYLSQQDTVYFFSTQSFLQLGSLSLQPEVPFQTVGDMIADSSGHYLLVADDEAIQVFDLLANTSTSAIASVGVDFSYQVPIYVTPKTSSITGLPAGLTFDNT